jgi:hypothetical protein
VNALRTADRAIGKLIDHFRDVEEKTLIVVLGDHLPGLSPSIYEALGFANEIDPPSLERRHSCPVVLWSNFGAPKIPIMTSMNFLGVEILRAAGLALPPFWRVAEGISRRFPVISGYIRDANGERMLWEDESDDQVIRDLGMLQYDLLFGRQFVLSPTTGHLR